MGREASVRCRLGAFDGTVKALLESTELILRSADLRRRWPVASVSAPRAEGAALHFSANGEDAVLYLGEKEAAAWARKISSPPPTLAAKLGLSAQAPVFVCGTVDDAALADALRGMTSADKLAAHQLIAIVLTQADLDAALAELATMTCAHAWMVYRKGKGSSPGDGAIRSVLREHGHVDTKTSAVSPTLTATRYTRRSSA